MNAWDVPLTPNSYAHHKARRCKASASWKGTLSRRLVLQQRVSCSASLSNETITNKRLNDLWNSEWKQREKVARIHRKSHKGGKMLTIGGFWRTFCEIKVTYEWYLYLWCSHTKESLAMRTHAHTYNSKETVFHCKRLRLLVAGVASRFCVTHNNNSNKSFADHSFPAALDDSLWRDTHTQQLSALYNILAILWFQMGLTGDNLTNWVMSEYWLVCLNSVRPFKGAVRVRLLLCTNKFTTEQCEESYSYVWYFVKPSPSLFVTRPQF